MNQNETSGLCRTLICQLDKLARHNRQGSYHTKSRCYEAMKRFCVFPALVYHLQKLTKAAIKRPTS